jgi:uncharacterized protein related to proFAR isomerase
VELPLEKTMWWLTESGAARYVYVRLPGSSAVGLGGDAAAAGVELQGIRALVDATGGPVIVSGGIHGPESLAAIAAIEGVEGAIVGRALFDGTMTFADAARAARDAFA